MAEIILDVGPAPATPDPNTVAIYAKTDKLLYTKDDAGVETAAVSVGLVHYQVVARVVLRI